MHLLRHRCGKDCLRGRCGGSKPAACEIEVSGQQLHLEQAASIIHLSVEVTQPIDELPSVRKLTVVGTQIRQQEEDSACGAIALRLIDANQRIESSGARFSPKTFRE